MGSFRPAPLDQLPIPQAAAPVDFKPAQIDQPPSPQPPGAGAMGTGGKIADVASNFLSGWLKGKQGAEQKKLAMAQQSVEGAHYAFQIAQTNAAQTANDPNATPDVKAKAEAARTQAWNSYLDVADKYTQPEKGKGGKGEGATFNGTSVKDHLKQAFGAEDPHMFAQASMALLRKSGPPPLPQKSSQDQLADLQLKGQKDINSAIDGLVEARRGGDPKAIAAAEQKVHDVQGQVQTPSQKLEDSLATATQSFMKGEEVNPQTKAALEARGFIPKPVEPNVFLQADDKGMLYSVSVDPTTGKTTKSASPIMKTRVPPDQRQEAYAIFKDQLNQLGTMLKGAHPDWSDEQIKQEQSKAMLSKEFGIKVAPRMSPGQSQTSVAKALNEVVNTMLEPDEQKQAQAILTRAQGVGGGGWMFRKDIAPRTGLVGWWDKNAMFGMKDKTPGGMTEQEADALDQKVRAATRQVMRDKMGMDPDQIDALVPETMGQDRAQSGLDPTPDQAGGVKTATMADVQQYAKANGMSVEDAKKKVEGEGYSVK